jgi:hypothetical protein
LDGAHSAADEGAQYRPQLEEQVPVEIPGRIITQDLVQDGAVQAHALTRLAHVVRDHPGPGQVQRQLHDPLGWAVQLASEADRSE